MAVAFLDFEQPIAELEAKIEELRHVTSESEVSIKDEISRLQAKSRQLTRNIFANLTPWQITQLARHPQRPYPLDYTGMILTEFHELHGDRMYADDMAIVGGLGRLENRVVMVIGHQKGRDTKERVRRNYGMPKPEGYRKALRLMKMANASTCPSSPSSTPRAPTRAWVPKSAARATPNSPAPLTSLSVAPVAPVAPTFPAPSSRAFLAAHSQLAGDAQRNADRGPACDQRDDRAWACCLFIKPSSRNGAARAHADGSGF